MTVADLLSRMSAREFNEWTAYYQLEPLGEQRDDLHAGIIAATVANSGFAQPKRAATPADFMPFRDRTPRDESIALSQRVRAALVGLKPKAAKKKAKPAPRTRARR
jgi:hypothetical protein